MRHRTWRKKHGCEEHQYFRLSYKRGGLESGTRRAGVAGCVAAGDRHVMLAIL